MAEEYECSECGEVHGKYGFGPHNRHAHDGDAERLEVETDTGDGDDAAGDLAADDLEDGDDSGGELEDTGTAGELELQEDTDRREYECGNCDTSVPYLGGDDNPEGPGMVCPECGNRLLWSQV